MKALNLTYIGLCITLITLCSWISIPSTIPFTLQTFAIFFTLGLLGGKKGCIAIIVYILLGALGIPVFAGFKSGIGTILGPTGGYIIGFIFSALVYLLFMRFFKENNISMTISMLIGLLCCYIFGTVWFMKIYTTTSSISLLTALKWCIIPFIIPDIIKIILAVIILNRIKRYIQLPNS